MRPISLALALSAFACSEYDLSGEKPDPEAGTTATVVTTFTGEECPDQTIDGFDAPFNEDCAVEVQTGTFTPVIEWSKATWADGLGDNIMSAPIVAELTDDNGDGKIDTNDIPDVIAVSYGWSNSGLIRAVSGADGSELWTNANSGAQPQGGVAAGDIDGDGLVEIVTLTPNGVAVMENDGTPKWQVSGLAGDIYGISDVASISDMDHDGKPEIIAGAAILDNKGNILGHGKHGRGGVANQNVGTCSFAVDLDGDGTEEVVTGNAAYHMDGSDVWFNGLSDGYPAVADFDDDGEPEIAVSGQGEMRLLETDGTLLWRVAIPGAGSSYYGGPPTIADYDGDGRPEIGVAAGSRYSVIDRKGNIVWQATTDDSSSGNTGSAVFDFEGDGVAEAVYGDQTRLWVFNGPDGAVKLSSDAHSNGTWLEYPVIADIDADDHAEIVVPNEPQYGGKTGLVVIGDLNNSWQPGRRIWNQHAYFLTNVNDDGTIPKTAANNWDTYNNFRSGDITSQDGLAAPDLGLVEGPVCGVQCDVGMLTVWVQVGNEGASDVLPADEVVVSLYAVIGGAEVLLEAKPVPGGVPQGVYLDSMQFDISGYDPTTFEQLIARVTSNALECDDTNNEFAFNAPFCE